MLAAEAFMGAINPRVSRSGRSSGWDQARVSSSASCSTGAKGLNYDAEQCRGRGFQLLTCPVLAEQQNQCNRLHGAPNCSTKPCSSGRAAGGCKSGTQTHCICAPRPDGVITPCSTVQAEVHEDCGRPLNAKRVPRFPLPLPRVVERVPDP